MDKDGLSSKLFNLAKDHAATRNKRFGGGAHDQIHYMAQRAADEIMAKPDAERPDAMRAADQAFERLVDEMISQADQIPQYTTKNPGVIGEETLTRALSILCPLFPIC